MHVGSTFSPLQPISAPRSNGSPLTPFLKPHASKQSPQSTTKTHLSNLDKILQKPISPLEQTKQTTSPNSSSSSTSTKRKRATPLNLSFFTSSSNQQQNEAMSPRSLTSLQFLMSDSAQPSPRANIAKNWHQYHGSDNWAGLLDPLDSHLRREILGYGDLVQSAYHAYFSNPTHQVHLSDSSYYVTRSLFATSSVQLPKWSPFASTKQSSWIGYVAVCDNEQEIRRMGRRDIAIVLRGTATSLEWAENFRTSLVPTEPDQTNGAKVECGFWSLYKSPGETIASLSTTIISEIRHLLNKYKGEELSITVTGHSLGAALSVLIADELSRCKSNMPPIAVFSFGGPRVGNRAFVDRVETRGVKVLRVVNAHDMVTRVPGLMPKEQIEQLFRGSWPERILAKIDGYVHVGQELRVDSRLSPVLRPDADPACCHDLEAYLHLVDGFIAKNCPFRANAKRSLVRLLKQQGGNVKQIFMSKGAIPVDRVKNTSSDDSVLVR
ncbi:hypothetical protein LUZ60_011731 [Juncus effusus]|nr:hypothetical protein LUZ60_011731 [Juncus effusus]